MEEEPTQPATQIVTDPRRLGQHTSDLNDEDLADIFCILHPASRPAYQAAALIAKSTPRYTVPVNSAEVKIKDEKSGGIDRIGTSDVSCDIALRLSAELKDLLSGHCFGRNPARCDFVIGHTDEVKRISNVHFRIYINEHGVIMLEDQSTNGTGVDGHLLRAKDKENGMDFRHTLEHGAIINITMTPPAEDYKFIVRIPQRDDYDDDAYQTNLTDYFIRRKTYAARKKMQPTTTGAVATKREPPNLFPTQHISSTSITRSREWKGGPKYNKIKMIGKGAFAVVFKITSKFDGVPFAAKELEKRRFMKNGILDQKVDSEMKIMQKIKHPNIVQYIEHIDWEEYLYIIMEYIPGGDLGTLILNEGHLPELTVKAMTVQILDALKYLHGLGITHRDIKPDNILMHSFDPLHIKLTDFGLSKMVDSEETFMRTFCGTLLYCAPEVYSEYREYDTTGRRTLRGVDKRSLPPQRYGHAVDVWSLAGVLFYALCGKPPFPVKNGTSYQELLSRIMSSPLDIRPLQRANISDNGIRFVRSMLHVRPEFRATIPDLEESPWLNSNSMEMSVELDEDDQAEITSDGFVEEHIEKGASQLSLGEGGLDEIDNNDAGSSDITELQNQLEIPSSFNTSDGNSNDSYGITHPAAGNGGRLFGEVAPSAFGSSGAIPFSAINLPIPHQPLVPRLTSDMADSSEQTTNTQSASPIEMSPNPANPRQSPSTVQAPVASKAIMPPPPPPVPAFNSANNKANDDDRQAERSSSLMGTESLVGHLNMRSTSNTPSPAAERLASPVPENHNPAVSLRRRREDEEGVEDWWPAEVPAPKRKKSAREFDLEVPAQIFWDPKDRSTHHNNYPRMTSSQWEAFGKAAAARGERFVPGNSFFASAMESFRSSRSPSVEPQTTQRATSEPARDDGHRMLMKRDDRKLEDDVTAQEARKKDANIPATARGSDITMNDVSQSNAGGLDTRSQPIVENEFQPPKRILAKFSATYNSFIPTITLNVVDPITTWGRGWTNTIKYPNGQEVKIPKYAFKLLLFKPGFYDDNISEPWDFTNSKNHDLTFYISSKATVGIWVNGVNLPSYDRQNPKTESKYWGELRHGDLVTVWQHDLDKKVFTRFRFECYSGKSKEVRTQPFQCLPEGPLVNEIERSCLALENALWEDQARKEADEERRKAKDKENKLPDAAHDAGKPVHRNKSAPPTAAGTDAQIDSDQLFSGTPSFKRTPASGGNTQPQIDFNQSFAGAPSFTRNPATGSRSRPQVDFNQSFIDAPSFIGEAAHGSRNGQQPEYNQSFNGASSDAGADNGDSEQLDFDQSFTGTPPYSQ